MINMKIILDYIRLPELSCGLLTMHEMNIVSLQAALNVSKRGRRCCIYKADCIPEKILLNKHYVCLTKPCTNLLFSKTRTVVPRK